MSIYLFKLDKNHDKLFPDGKPRSYYFIIAKIVDYWEMHPLRPEFVTAYATRFQKYKYAGPEVEAFKEKYITKYLITDGLTGMAPGYHFETGVHRSWRLIERLPIDGEIKVPCVIYWGKKVGMWMSGHVYEGHHRAGAANCIKWRYIPAIVMHCVGTGKGYCNMTDEDREEMGKIQDERGLINTSRIHGVQIALWTASELRSFMFPRADDKTKFSIQSLNTTECIGSEHLGWKDYPYDPIKLNAGHGVFKAPEVL